MWKNWKQASAANSGILRRCCDKTILLKRFQWKIFVVLLPMMGRYGRAFSILFFLQVWEVMGGGVMTEMLCVSRSVLVSSKKKGKQSNFLFSLKLFHHHYFIYYSSVSISTYPALRVMGGLEPTPAVGQRGYTLEKSPVWRKPDTEWQTGSSTVNKWKNEHHNNKTGLFLMHLAQ